VRRGKNSIVKENPAKEKEGRKIKRIKRKRGSQGNILKKSHIMENIGKNAKKETGEIEEDQAFLSYKTRKGGEKASNGRRGASAEKKRRHC